MIGMPFLDVDPDKLGECPVWDAAEERLHWIDVVGKRISSCSIDGRELQQRHLDERPGCFALRRNGGKILAYRTRLVLLDANGDEEREIATDPVDWDHERFNEGACDAEGRFWVGTMDRRVREPVGALYRVDADLRMHRMADRFVLSNGLAWSPDGRLLYHCDTGDKKVHVYDFDVEDGTIGNPHVHYQFASDEGAPDGCAMDSEGHLWVAALGIGALLKIAPNGIVSERLAIPSMRPTSVGFGGPDLRTMFVTTMMPLDEEPQAEDGRLFRTNVMVPGLPRHPFSA